MRSSRTWPTRCVGVALTFLINVCLSAILVTVVVGCGSGGKAGSNNNSNDNGSAVCGNGTLDLGEACDDGTANSDSTPDACRTDCRSAWCGDAVVDSGEQCDSASLGGLTCADASGFSGGPLACTSGCELDTSACTTCGNGVQEGDEDCDGFDLAGSSCGDHNLQHGSLWCASDCTYDLSECHWCDNGTVEGPEDCGEGQPEETCESLGYSYGTLECDNCVLTGSCESICGNADAEPNTHDPADSDSEECDGVDLRGNTCAGLGYEGGVLRCSATCGFDESDCHNCGNGSLDPAEECDGANIGGADCFGLAGTPSCTPECRLDRSTCVVPPNCGDGSINGPDGEQCDGAALLGFTCATVPGGNFGGGTLGCASNCLFDTSGCVPVNPCGNGVLEMAYGEQCDDTELGAATCTTQGFTGGTLACSSQCTFDVSACTAPPECGNGVTDVGEACDPLVPLTQTCADLNFDSGTLACTTLCTVDTSGCAGCGNGVREGGELCDGADLDNTDCQNRGFYGGVLHCNGTCDGWDDSSCFGECGDGVINGNELCDGAATGSTTCTSLGYYTGTLVCNSTCDGFNTNVCSGTCGDGAIDAGLELCDGNEVGVQDCTTVPGGFTSGTLICNGACDAYDTSGCSVITCGNGVLEAGEACDDGNLNPGDGCRADCTQELCGDGIADASDLASCWYEPSGYPINVGQPVWDITAGDLNGDTHADVVMATRYGNQVKVYLGDGTGQLTFHTNIAMNNAPMNIQLGHFSADTNLDLVTVGENSNLRVYLGDGTGGFSEATGSPYAFVWGNPTIRAIDLNGDGRSDLVARIDTTLTESLVRVYLGDDTGGLTEAAGSPYTFTGDRAGGSKPTVARFDGDAHLDIALGGRSRNGVILLLGDGTGDFTEAAYSPIIVGGAIELGLLNAGDVNGDSNMDLVGSCWNSSCGIVVLLGDGAGGFVEAVGSPIGVPSFLCGTLEDMDGDGLLDVLAADYWGSDVSVLQGDGAGGFSIKSGSPWSAGLSGPRQVSVTDLNEDLVPDALIPYSTGQGFTVFLSNP